VYMPREQTVGYYFSFLSASRFETRRFQAYGSTASNLYSPTTWCTHYVRHAVKLQDEALLQRLLVLRFVWISFLLCGCVQIPFFFTLRRPMQHTPTRHAALAAGLLSQRYRWLEGTTQRFGRHITIPVSQTFSIQLVLIQTKK
jgi:hypothetical protein